MPVCVRCQDCYLDNYPLTSHEMKFRTLLPHITPHRNTLIGVIALLLGSSLLSIIQPWLAGQFASSILEETGALSAGFILILWFCLLLMRSCVEFGSQYFIGSTGEQLTASLRSRVFTHLQRMPASYLDAARHGDLIALLSNDVEQVSGFVTNTLVQLLPLMLTFIGAGLMLALTSPTIAILALIFIPLYYLVVKALGRRLRPLSRNWIDAHSNLLNFLSEHLTMGIHIRSFSRGAYEGVVFETHNSELLSISRRQLFYQSILGPTVGLLSGLGLLLLLWLASKNVLAQGMRASELVSLVLYAMLMTQPMRGLANLYGHVQTTRGAAGRILAFLAQSPEPDDEGLPELDKVRGDIDFENVTFNYPGSPPAVRDISLKICAGETVAITGENGCGKSTLVNLLMRFYDPQRGRILLDQTDLRQVSVASIRRQIGLVPQRIILFDGTIAENIAYGQPLVEHDEIVRAARQAHAEAFIDRLPDGYQTRVGDRGFRLSGGQQQRIALARALLPNPPILVLDEATAMFDLESERQWVAQISKELLGQTVLLITHRKASLALADRIVHISPGGEIQASSNGPITDAASNRG